MSTSGDGDPFLRDLEVEVRTELVIAETSQPEEDADGVPDAGMLLDPDIQLYEASLRALLGAVEVMEDAAPDGPDTRRPGQAREAQELAGDVPRKFMTTSRGPAS